jgi:hypothetical protein
MCRVLAVGESDPSARRSTGAPPLRDANPIMDGNAGTGPLSAPVADVWHESVDAVPGSTSSRPVFLCRVMIAPSALPRAAAVWRCCFGCHFEERLSIRDLRRRHSDNGRLNSKRTAVLFQYALRPEIVDLLPRSSRANLDTASLFRKTEISKPTCPRTELSTPNLFAL